MENDLNPFPNLSSGSCSTFVLERESRRIIGHNLDEYHPTPGLVMFNPRGMRKRGAVWSRKAMTMKTSADFGWTSKHSSLTYNTFGRDFPDGGMNEAGLFVGEMTLFATEFPSDDAGMNIYHNNWMQYLLDTLSSVEEVIESLTSIHPDGHCKWHFLLSDENNQAAVLEFLGGKAKVYKGKDLPYKILCNDTYEAELKDLANYDGFGGNKEPGNKYGKEDPRFRWAATMNRKFDWKSSPIAHAFSVLERLDLGNNQWSLVFDSGDRSLYFQTRSNRDVRRVSFRDFDGGKEGMAYGVDIDAGASGSAKDLFKPITGDLNAKYVKKAWAAIDAGFLGNLIFKRAMSKHMIAHFG